MIAEASKVATLGRVDEFALTKGHEIEMLDAFIVIGNHALAECGLGDGLADVLEDEVVWAELGVGTEAIAFVFGLDDRDIGVATLEKSLVLTGLATTTIVGAFHFTSTIDAVGIISACMIDVFDGVCVLRSASNSEQRKLRPTPFFGTITVQSMIAETEILVLVGTGVDNCEGRCSFGGGIREVVKHRSNARRQFGGGAGRFCGLDRLSGLCFGRRCDAVGFLGFFLGI